MQLNIECSTRNQEIIIISGTSPEKLYILNSFTMSNVNVVFCRCCCSNCQNQSCTIRVAICVHYIVIILCSYSILFLKFKCSCSVLPSVSGHFKACKFLDVHFHIQKILGGQTQTLQQAEVDFNSDAALCLGLNPSVRYRHCFATTSLPPTCFA